jgi:hypothetical protein
MLEAVLLLDAPAATRELSRTPPFWGLARGARLRTRPVPRLLRLRRRCIREVRAGARGGTGARVPGPSRSTGAALDSQPLSSSRTGARGGGFAQEGIETLLFKGVAMALRLASGRRGGPQGRRGLCSIRPARRESDAEAVQQRDGAWRYLWPGDRKAAGSPHSPRLRDNNDRRSGFRPALVFALHESIEVQGIERATVGAGSASRSNWDGSVGTRA